MATVPFSATNIRLMSDVPFFNDYANVRYFTSKTDQEAYFSTRPTVKEMNQASFTRHEKGAFIMVSASIDKLYNASYVEFVNAGYSNKKFFGFITSLEFDSKNATKVYISIDVFQTWLFDISFKPSYIEREHQSLWDTNGLPITNTIPEGLEHGSMYQMVHEEHIKPSDLLFLVVVTSKEITTGSADTKIGMVGTPTPLYQYVIPYGRTNGIPITLNGNLLAPFPTLMREFSQNEDIVNSIQTMYVSDYVGINFVKEGNGNYTSNDVSTRPLIGSTFHLGCVKDMFDFRNSVQTIRDVFSKFTSVSESKLLMYPYALVELDDLKGNRLELKPELLIGNSIDIVIKGNIGYTNKVTYEVKNYNTEALEFVATLQNSIIDMNPNDVPIVSEYLSSMMQGQRNSLEARKDNARDSGMMTALNGSLNGVASAMINPAQGVATATTGIANGAMQSYMETKSINAQIQDASAIPPNIQKMGGVTSFDYGYNLSGVRLVFKQITKEYRDTLTDFFKKYGYKVNRIKIPNLRTRQAYNFVKTVDCMVIGSVNNEDIQEFRNIFNNGVTLWHTNNMGDYSQANGVR